jgi:hypothetical protein
VSQEANYSVTFKTPRGNLLTVRGDTADEWKGNLAAAGESGALIVIAGIEASLSGSPAPAQPSQPRAAQSGQELPSGFDVKCETCGGPAKLVQEGTSKRSGLPFKRYSCTTNALHKATFTNS